MVSGNKDHYAGQLEAQFDQSTEYVQQSGEEANKHQGKVNHGHLRPLRG
jgi:hypothetical protein